MVTKPSWLIVPVRSLLMVQVVPLLRGVTSYVVAELSGLMPMALAVSCEVPPVVKRLTGAVKPSAVGTGSILPQTMSPSSMTVPPTTDENLTGVCPTEPSLHVTRPRNAPALAGILKML